MFLCSESCSVFSQIRFFFINQRLDVYEMLPYFGYKYYLFLPNSMSLSFETYLMINKIMRNYLFLQYAYDSLWFGLDTVGCNVFCYSISNTM